MYEEENAVAARHRRVNVKFATLGAVVALALASCGSDDDSRSNQESSPTQSPTSDQSTDSSDGLDESEDAEVLEQGETFTYEDDGDVMAKITVDDVETTTSSVTGKGDDPDDTFVIFHVDVEGKGSYYQSGGFKLGKSVWALVPEGEKAKGKLHQFTYTQDDDNRPANLLGEETIKPGESDSGRVYIDGPEHGTIALSLNGDLVGAEPEAQWRY